MQQASSRLCSITWSWNASDGQWLNHMASPQNQWVSRCMDLSGGGQTTGSTITLSVLRDFPTPAGPWDIYYADMSITSTDGTVTQIVGSNPAIDPTPYFNGDYAYENASGRDQLIPAATLGATAATHFFVSDHLGTAQMEFSSGGWPLWQGQFAPFGQELDTQPTANHYKFTGKERDAESGLDYFGARYYASSMGRWMSLDWRNPTQPVPYANLDRPQSLNLYGYVENNPLSQIDDDGHLTVMYDGHAQTITVRANDGTETTFLASNNPQMSLTIGKLVDGNYAFLDKTRPHHHSAEEDSHNGAYGPGGILRLKPFKNADGKEHDGVGLHAGRADSTDRAGRSGCNYATNGCVGTTEKAIQFIINLAPGNPLTDLQVRNNRNPPKDDHGDHPGPNPAPKPLPHLIPRAQDGGNNDQ